MKIRFDDIGEQSKAKEVFHDKFQVAFDDIYEWAERNYDPTFKFKLACTDRLNCLIEFLLVDGKVPYYWDSFVQTGEGGLDLTSDSLCNTCNLTFNVNDIDWSCFSHREDAYFDENKKPLANNDPEHTEQEKGGASKIESRDENIGGSPHATDKSDLFIVSTPRYPRVGNIDSSDHGIRKSLPIVPERQCDISATTDASSLNSDQLLRLYPNRFIRTRSSCMYTPRDGMTFDPDFGLLVPVDGFTDAQVRDCIIRYPHIFQLRRIMPDGSLVSFYNHIEMDGELIDVAKAWKYLPESSVIDFDSMDDVKMQREFLKEYVIRRYLLERDVAGIEHKYKIRGSLPPYITLFMPESMYMAEGITDTVALARTCVESRIEYLRSRNPRIVGDTPTVDDCPFSPFCGADICDRSCPKWAQISYLLMRNGLTLSSIPFSMKDSALRRYTDIYDTGKGLTNVLMSTDTLKASEVMSYICVCNRWNKSAMRVKAYHLVLSSYVDGLKSSFGDSLPDDVAYAQMWSKSCDDLVISGLDYMNLKDFACQILLQLLQDRERNGKTTFVVTPDISTLVGSGDMFKLLKDKLGCNRRNDRTRLVRVNKELM